MSERSRFSQYKNKVLQYLKEKNPYKKSGFIEILEKGLEKELKLSREKDIPIENLPVDLALRQKGFFRNIYENIFPVNHVFEISYKYDGQFLDNYMPISNDSYIGRGSYKFVYKLPWNQVVKIGKSKFYSDPIFGSLFREVAEKPEKYLKAEEMQLKLFLENQVQRRSKKEEIDLKFKRLAMERLHYWKVKSLLPDLVLPTRFFMGLRYRARPFMQAGATLTPCDVQNALPGKHLKEFVSLEEKEKSNILESKLFPKWRLNFDTHRFGLVSRTKLKKIAFNFHRVIEATKYLASKEKLILDLHSENIIITIPEFELKIFDFHVFDEHLYETSSNATFPEQDHIETIKRFIDSFELGKKPGDSDPAIEV
ncbi:MAG: hypothetical protein AAF518_04980 [Spirochaetota bacterium]